MITLNFKHASGSEHYWQECGHDRIPIDSVTPWQLEDMQRIIWRVMRGSRSTATTAVPADAILAIWRERWIGIPANISDALAQGSRLRTAAGKDKES